MTNAYRLTTAFAGAALGFAMSLSTVACTVDSDQPIFIIQNQEPSADCGVSASKSQAFVSRGVLDTEGSQVYVLTPLVENRARSIDPNDPLQRAAFIEGAEVSLSLPDGVSVDSQFTNFTQRFSGTIEPGALAGFAFEVIPPQVTAAMASAITPPETLQIIADVEIFGELGGGGVSSQTFSYPIAVCTNCRKAAPSCVDYQAPTELSCFPGQDNFLIECCTSEIASPGEVLCPPVPETVVPDDT